MFYQDKNLKYTDALVYDKRGESSVLENYVLGLWQPFLKQKIRELSGSKVVADLGCGTCEYTQAAKAAKKIYVVDISELMLEACHTKLKDFIQVEMFKGSVLDIDLPAADLIITIGVWEYINPEKLIIKIKEITRKDSKVIVVFPNIYNDLNLVRSIFKMKCVALRPGFIKKLFKADFELLESASFGMVSWVPKRLQILALPVWKSCDWLWLSFQNFLPLGVNVYYLFERK